MNSPFSLVTIGASAGGLNALQALLCPLPADFPLPILVVQHQGPGDGLFLPAFLGARCQIQVVAAEDKQVLKAGRAAIAPPGYHLLLEWDLTLSLSMDPPVHYARPSIDVLFDSAAQALGPGVIGIILTGASCDGSQGLKRIRQRGGLAIVQDPATAEVDYMPRCAIEQADPQVILSLQDVAPFLTRLAQTGQVEFIHGTH